MGMHPSVAAIMIGPGGSKLRELERETGRLFSFEGMEGVVDVAVGVEVAGASNQFLRMIELGPAEQAQIAQLSDDLQPSRDARDLGRGLQRRLAVNRQCLSELFQSRRVVADRDVFLRQQGQGIGEFEPALGVAGRRGSRR